MAGGTHCVCGCGEILVGFQGEVRWGKIYKDAIATGWGDVDLYNEGSGM